MVEIKPMALGIKMENYEAKLLSIKSEELSLPKGNILFGDLIELVSIKNNDAYERSLKKLAIQLPYQTSLWPSFGKYCEDWYKVEVGEFKRQLLYCERGSCTVREDCQNLIDLSYHILNIVSPGFTPSAVRISENLDRIKDQRLLIWLGRSSEIYHMYQVNQYFGVRMLNANVAWMCEELVRMGVFKWASDAFKSEWHIVQGLRLSGLPKGFALNLYQELRYA
jgi:hypothetical protein